MAEFQNISDTCGYTTYLDDFVTYPPAGQLPPPVGATINEATGEIEALSECRLHSPIQRAVTLYVNRPCFEESNTQ